MIKQVKIINTNEYNLSVKNESHEHEIHGCYKHKEYQGNSKLHLIIIKHVI